MNNLYYSGTHRIVDDVIADGFNVFVVPQCPIMISGLPDSSCSTHHPVYSTCGPAFHSSDDRRQVIASQEFDHPMKMIWHYDVGECSRAFSRVRFSHFVFYYFAEGYSFEDSIALRAARGNEIDPSGFGETPFSQFLAVWLIPRHNCILLRRAQLRYNGIFLVYAD